MHDLDEALNYLLEEEGGWSDNIPTTVVVRLCTASLKAPTTTGGKRKSDPPKA
jgi:hypothetical protein